MSVNDLWEQAKAETLVSLYKNDPLIRASLDAQLNTPPLKPKSSVVMRDAQGKVVGVEGGSVLSGKNANSRSEKELWNALMEQTLNTKKDNNDGQ